MKAGLHWFRRDLRFHDNPALAASLASCEVVFAAFCLAELDRLNVRQQSFVMSCLRELRAALAKRNATLSLIGGDPGKALADCALRLGAHSVFTSRAFGTRELELQNAVAKTLAAAGIDFLVRDGDTVHSPEAVAAVKQAPGDGYRVFPPFYDAWRSLQVPAPSADGWPNGYDPCYGEMPRETLGQEKTSQRVHMPTGEAAALQALHSFVGSRVCDYAASSEYPSRTGTSGLAAALRFGCVSPRAVYHAVAQRMSRSWVLAQERLSMQAFFRKLAFRDFFMHLAYFAPEVHDTELQAKMRGFAWSRDTGTVAAWLEGRTGYPFVDAAMRQLRQEGHVHQRAAIVSASFCCFDLGLDWRVGRDEWMRSLVAADEALCDGNWQWIAGVGSDQAAYPRIYNPLKQAQYFDVQAVYVRRYCSELGKLPSSAALQPWLLEGQQQIELGFFTPGDYPQPIVEHESVARAALARYHEFRDR